ncbi:hypothetical protein M3193_03620 [Sporosarcina luteola]|uniref:hypothetical protein n=1 Tax=Sporosarcina luteola TaxID=582850 RepID=UPI00203A6989|nr:hypothetical protein [Sporosarcina luteola]MCM3743222.1 hypothetical protein [Sporosarcina luteola]
MKKVVILALTFLFLYGCSDNSNVNSNENLERKYPSEDPVNITQEEAIEIALHQAEADGYKSAVLEGKIPVTMRSVYSVKYDRDMRIYDVRMSSPEKFIIYYYVSTENGELIESVH